MFLRKNKKEKILAIILALLLWINPLVIPVAWAEGEEDQPPVGIVSSEITPTPTEVPSSESEPTPELLPESFPDSLSEPAPDSQPEPTIAPEPSPTSQPSEIQTGDAEALSEAETKANTNQEALPGEIAVSEGDCTLPEGLTECLGKIEVSNSNSAEVSNTASSSATTGSNQIQNSDDDANIQTGDATALGLVDNKINSNIIELESTATPSAVPTPEETITKTTSEEEGKEPALEEPGLLIENENEGELINKVAVEASTGENFANENASGTAILTGDALALVNILNFLNTNIVGSNFEVFLQDILGNESGEIDLNQLWKEILAQSGQEGLSLAGEINSSSLKLLVENVNQAYLENNVNVEVSTGENQANGNKEAKIETGEAAAVANVNNFVNTNILGAEFFLGTINILGEFEGNLILPQPENFRGVSEESLEQSFLIFQNQNQAEVENRIEVTANSGGNEESGNKGDSVIKTGDAVAISNVFSLVNLNVWQNSWFVLLINNLGNWTGKIFGWSTSEAKEEPQEGNQVFQVGMKQSANEEENLELKAGSLPLVSFQNKNQAIVKNNIKTTASTGQNQANENQGETQIETGNAFSLANLFNFVNLNVLGGRWFFGLVNVLGDWRGNVIFAYPDLTVNLTSRKGQVVVGEETELSLVYKNQGYEQARGVVLRIELPGGIEYLGDDSGYPVVVSERTCSWDVGNLEAGEEGGFKIRVRVSTNFSFEEKLSFWSKIIPQVYAAENQKEKEIQITASIITSDPESDFSNNNSLTKTLVYLPSFRDEELLVVDENSSQEIDQRQPVLEISAWNNVGEFVYPEDTVTFEIKIYNKGEVPAYDVYLLQDLYNSMPEDFGAAKFYIGTIAPKRGVKITFGIKLNGQEVVPEGHFYTLAQAFGKAPNGNEVVSNEARTDFNVRHKEIASLFIAKALGKEEKVLGIQESECPSNEEKVLPYVLLFVLSSAWIVEKSKRISGLIKNNEN